MTLESTTCRIRCYESVLKNAPELHGQVGVRFTLRVNDRVEAAGLAENTT